MPCCQRQKNVHGRRGGERVGFLRTFTTVAACFAGLTFSAVPTNAQVADAAPVTANALKAAFLFKFAGYVAWPDAVSAADAPLTIGVAGSELFERELVEVTRGRTVGGRPINVRRVSGGDSFEGLQILFIAREARAGERNMLADARSRPILTVTESSGGLTDGSIINFTQMNDRVRFEISLYAADRSQLKLNSRLLAVADAVHRGPE